MSAPVDHPPRCDREVYENGDTICTFHAASAPTEAWVRKVRAASGQRVDWHYVGGYAVVRFIGDRELDPATTTWQWRAKPGAAE